ncbi:MAG: Helix-turn-helix, type 11 domain protein [Geobacteraceae bacterium]|nr:Helix-turn-helix, type 11 domain protein [Geobacteraceae bacterium]
MLFSAITKTIDAEARGFMKKGKPEKKYSQAGRVHDIIRLIEARYGVTVEELAEETGVDRRTIYRDLSVIHEAGYPLVSEWRNGRKAYRFLTRFKDIPPISFTLQELMTISFLRSQLDFLKGTPFQDDMESIYGKINSVLPPRYAAHMERIAGVSMPVLQGRRDYAKASETLKTVREALLFQYSLMLEYTTGGSGAKASYKIDPYTMVSYKGGLYLLGFAHNRQALRTFAVERISTVEVSRERFEIPEDFSPEQQFKTAFGIVGETPMPVRVRFSPRVAHTIHDRVWHPTQSIEKQSDGSIILAFEAGGVMEIVSWVLSFGDSAEILEPEKLRDDVRKAVHEMCKLYGPLLTDC